MLDNAIGGNDVLITRAGSDDMWGDASLLLGNAVGGSDTFVFDHGGRDTIHDFEQGKDHIDLTAYHLSGIAALNITSDAGGSVINLGDENTIIVVNVLSFRTPDIADFRDWNHGHFSARGCGPIPVRFF